MLYIKNEYETPINSSFYQNNRNNSNPEEPKHNQITINYTAQAFGTNSNINKLYQNTTNKTQPPKEKNEKFHFS